MTIKQAQKRIEEVADYIDDYLGELERSGKDKGKKYDALLELACELRELVDKDFD